MHAHRLHLSQHRARARARAKSLLLLSRYCHLRSITRFHIARDRSLLRREERAREVAKKIRAALEVKRRTDIEMVNFQLYVIYHRE